MIWTEEERVLRDERGAWFSPIRGAKGVEAMRQREGSAWQGYGAVGSTSTKPSSIQGGKQIGTFYDESVEQRIIDHEQERMTAAVADSKDVVMRWTRMRRNDNDGGSVSRTVPVISRTNSRSGVISPPDAVDLVIGAPRTAELESRSRGGSSYKKVYRTRGEEDDGAVVEPREQLTTNRGTTNSGWTTNVVQRERPITLRPDVAHVHRHDDIPDDHNPWA